MDQSASRERRPGKYPKDHVLGIVDTPESANAVSSSLKSSGFLDSEIELASGTDTADHMKATSGHKGLYGAILKLADRLGIREDELEEKHTYEEALRAGKTVVLIHTPTEERKQLAAAALKAQGGDFIHFMGRFTSERL